MRIVLVPVASPADVEAWEDIVEVSIAIPPGAEVVWMTWAGEDGGGLDLTSGTYRVRVSACGRDAGHEGEFVEGAVDRYLLELWPAPVRPDGDHPEHQRRRRLLASLAFASLSGRFRGSPAARSP